MRWCVAVVPVNDLSHHLSCANLQQAADRISPVSAFCTRSPGTSFPQRRRRRTAYAKLSGKTLLMFCRYCHAFPPSGKYPRRVLLHARARARVHEFVIKSTERDTPARSTQVTEDKITKGDGNYASELYTPCGHAQFSRPRPHTFACRSRYNKLVAVKLILIMRRGALHAWLPLN